MWQTKVWPLDASRLDYSCRSISPNSRTPLGLEGKNYSMNAAHSHLLLNHFPLIGFVFSFLLLALGQFRSNESYVRAGISIILVSGFLAVPTYLAGEPAEEVIKKLPGFSENLVEAHEEAAELAIWFIGATTLVAGVALWLSIKKTVTSKIIYVLYSMK